MSAVPPLNVAAGFAELAAGLRSGEHLDPARFGAETSPAPSWQ